MSRFHYDERNFVLDARLRHIGPLLGQVGLRLDAAETSAFSRQLQYTMARVHEIKYPARKGRLFCPVSHEVPTGAQSFGWSLWDIMGKVDIIGPKGDDLPTVETASKETIQRVESLGVAYGWDVQELRAAQFGGIPLEIRKAKAVRDVFEAAVDSICAIGNTTAGLPGMLKNSAVSVIVAGGAITGAWLTGPKTPAQILADLNVIGNYSALNTNETFSANSLLLPLAQFQYIADTPWSSTVGGESILSVFLKNSPYIKNVDSWSFLSTADVAGTGTRAVAYNRSPDTLELIIPQEFEQFAPQVQGTKFRIPCHGRIAGVTVYEPGAMVYADGI